MTIPANLLDILVCPQCKGPVKITPEEDFLDCHVCRLRYPVRDDIPVMLVDEAQVLTDDNL